MLRLNPYRRRLSLLIAVFFVAITLLVQGPHGHAPLKIGDTIVAADGLEADTVDCPLCHWLTMSYTAPAMPDAVAILTTIAVKAGFTYATDSLCCLAVPHRSLRAPPHYA